MKRVFIIILMFSLISSASSIERIYQNTKRIKFAFALSDMKPFLKIKKIILWITEDNGINWYRGEKFDLKRNDKGENYIEWDAPYDGDFGFILSYELEGLKELPKPSLMDLPQYVVTVDTKSPKVIYFRCRYIDKRKGVLKLKWKVADKNLAYQGIKLLHKENGNLQIINESMPEEGEMTWYITDNSQKYLQFAIKVNDLAGNETVKIISKKNIKFSDFAKEKLKSVSVSGKEEDAKTKQHKARIGKPEEVKLSIKETKSDTSIEKEKKEEPMVNVSQEKTAKEYVSLPVTEGRAMQDKKKQKVIPIKIPLNIKGDKSRLTSIVVYYTIDKGKTWNKYYELSPYDDYLVFYADRERLYGFYFVFKTKDNISFPKEPASGDVPYLYRYVDITAPKVRLYTPSIDILVAGKIYKIGWKIYDKNLDASQSKLSVSYDAGKSWRLLAKSLPNKGKINFRAPTRDLDGTLLFKLEAQDLVGLSSSVVSKLYTVNKYDFEISFSEKKTEQEKVVSQAKEKKKIKKATHIKKHQDSHKKDKMDYTKIERILKDAKVLISQGQYYDALQNLRQIAEEDPTNVEVLSLMGYIHILQGNYSEGIKVLTHALAIDCSDFTNFYNLEIGLIKVNNIFDGTSKLMDFFKCVSLDSLDRNKKEKLNSIISILNVKATALSDSGIKSKLGYVKNLLQISELESAHK